MQYLDYYSDLGLVLSPSLVESQSRETRLRVLSPLIRGHSLERTRS